jgi:uncharacterized protein (DUF4415 family)
MKQRLLFLCTHNSARSQMAEGSASIRARVTVLRLGRAATARVLIVAYTVRRRDDGESIRIISARRGAPAQLPSTATRWAATPRGRARRLIAIRIDPQVLDAVRREAKRRGLGYQSLINDLLAKHIGRVRSA